MNKYAKHEQILADRLGGIRQIGSGNKPMMKGDVKSEKFLFEIKCTENGRRSLIQKEFEKISQQSFRQNKLPAMIFTLNFGKKEEETYLILRLRDYE